MDREALLLDGGRDDGDETRDTAALAVELLGADGWRVTHLALREIEIAPCFGCFGCWVRTPGVCVIDDAGRDVARRMVQSDLLVYLTPLTFGGYSSELKKAVDRLIPNILPFFQSIDGEVHHVKRYERYPRLVAIGVAPSGPVDPEDEELFETLVHRNAINYRAPSAAACVIAASDDDAVRRDRIARVLEVDAGGGS